MFVKGCLGLSLALSITFENMAYSDLYWSSYIGHGIGYWSSYTVTKNTLKNGHRKCIITFPHPAFTRPSENDVKH